MQGEPVPVPRAATAGNVGGSISMWTHAAGRFATSGRPRECPDASTASVRSIARC